MQGLLDVNVLVALFDPAHPNHEDAHAWLQAHHRAGWATCTLTINGCVRVLSSPAYPSFRVTPAAVIEGLRRFCESPFHSFWPDRTNLLDPSVIRPQSLPGHAAITDVSLLALACENGGRLITFDRSIPLRAVPSATSANLCVIGSAG